MTIASVRHFLTDDSEPWVYAKRICIVSPPYADVIRVQISHTWADSPGLRVALEVDRDASHQRPGLFVGV